jgi:hypothetical protein
MQISSNGTGIHLTLDNGLTVSIQWGRGNYGTNRFNEEIAPADRVETAFWIGDEPMITLPTGDSVSGYVPVPFILQLALTLNEMSLEEAKKEIQLRINS